jgi:hypothetical protein
MGMVLLRLVKAVCFSFLKYWWIHAALLIGALFSYNEAVELGNDDKAKLIAERMYYFPFLMIFYSILLDIVIRSR